MMATPNAPNAPATTTLPVSCDVDSFSGAFRGSGAGSAKTVDEFGHTCSAMPCAAHAARVTAENRLSSRDGSRVSAASTSALTVASLPAAEVGCVDAAASTSTSSVTRASDCVRLSAGPPASDSRRATHALSSWRARRGNGTCKSDTAPTTRTDASGTATSSATAPRNAHINGTSLTRARGSLAAMAILKDTHSSGRLGVMEGDTVADCDAVAFCGAVAVCDSVADDVNVADGVADGNDETEAADVADGDRVGESVAQPEPVAAADAVAEPETEAAADPDGVAVADTVGVGDPVDEAVVDTVGVGDPDDDAVVDADDVAEDVDDDDADAADDDAGVGEPDADADADDVTDAEAVAIDARAVTDAVAEPLCDGLADADAVLEAVAVGVGVVHAVRWESAALPVGHAEHVHAPSPLMEPTGHGSHDTVPFACHPRPSGLGVSATGAPAAPASQVYRYAAPPPGGAGSAHERSVARAGSTTSATSDVVTSPVHAPQSPLAVPYVRASPATARVNPVPRRSTDAYPAGPLCPDPELHAPPYPNCTLPLHHEEYPAAALQSSANANPVRTRDTGRSGVSGCCTCAARKNTARGRRSPHQEHPPHAATFETPIRVSGIGVNACPGAARRARGRNRSPSARRRHAIAVRRRPPTTVVSLSSTTAYDEALTGLSAKAWDGHSAAEGVARRREITSAAVK
jgi:hypothetical protein